MDEIRIERLGVEACVGVPDEERQQPQRLEIDLRLRPAKGFSALGDDVANTVDYDAVAREVRALCGRGERRLIETLAEEIAEMLLRNFPLLAVECEVRKFVLRDCDSVSVRIRREGAGE